MANITIKQAIKMAAAAAKTYTDQVASTKVNVVSGKGLSTNDLTNDMVANYGAAYQHSLQAHAPANAQKNSDITKAEIEAKLTGNIGTHTHTYAGSSSAGGAATSANKVNSNLVVQLNGGSTEGSNKFTFNGSEVKTVNITPGSIGASDVSHFHDDRYYTETEMDTKLAAKADSSHGTHVTYGTTTTSLTSGGTGVVGTSGSVARADHTHTLPAYPTELKNPNAVKIQLNGGTTEGTNQFTYDGSGAKTINITPASIGAAGSSHGTHLTLGTGSGNAYRGDYGDAAYQHSLTAHAPSNAQKNSDITKAEIENKLTGNIDTHTHSYLPLAGGTLTGPLTIGGMLSDSRITTGNKQLINTNGTTLYLGNPNTPLKLESSNNPTITVGTDTYTFYHSGNKPTYSDVGAAQAGHTHDDRYFTESEMDTKINTINTAISTAQSAAQSYADTKIAALVNSAPEALNTLNELATAITEHQEVYEAYVAEMSAALEGKANSSHGNHVPATQTANNAIFLRNDNTWATVTPDNIGAAKAFHGTHVTWATNAPAANGTASAGSVDRVAREDHVHPLQTSVSGNAGSANKVNTNLTIKLNGGSTEGTNLFTFNGSNAKTINITPASIGAAASHGHDSYINQNAFSNVKVGSTTITADSATDTLTLTAGSNITLTADASGDGVTIAATDTVYTHPSHTAYSSGLYKITVNNLGHVTAATAVAKADITALGIPGTNTTYSTGTASALGLTKLYTGTGTATDGTMTQAAIKSALDGKSDTSHVHYIDDTELAADLAEVFGS